MKKLLIIFSILIGSISCQKVIGDKFNIFSHEFIYMGLEGGTVNITAEHRITIMYIECGNEGWRVHSQPRVYPYTLESEWCVMTITAPKEMSIEVFECDQKREIMLSLGGYDDEGLSLSPSPIYIRQGYSAPPSVSEPTK